MEKREKVRGKLTRKILTLAGRVIIVFHMRAGPSVMLNVTFLGITKETFKLKSSRKTKFS